MFMRFVELRIQPDKMEDFESYFRNRVEPALSRGSHRHPCRGRTKRSAAGLLPHAFESRCRLLSPQQLRPCRYSVESGLLGGLVAAWRAAAVPATG